MNVRAKPGSNLSTFSQALWRQVTRGQVTEREWFNTLMEAVKSDKVQAEVDSMPPEMVREILRIMSPKETKNGRIRWSREASISTSLAHAANFSFQLAGKWKRARLKEVYAAIKRRQTSEENSSDSGDALTPPSPPHPAQ